jgi:hypothetical protein
MKRKLSLAVVLCLFLVGFGQAQTSLKVIEPEIKAFSSAENLQINLAVESSFRQKTSARIRLEILDENDKILSSKGLTAELRNGKNQLSFALPLGTQTAVKDLLWRRLRYAVEANRATASGIVSLSEIMPELFELRVAAFKEIYAGMLYQARVRAFHPINYKPIADVEISAELKLDVETPAENDDDELIIKTFGKTDAEGFALLEFQIPPTVKFSDNYSGRIEVKGRKNGLTGNADDNLETEEKRVSIFFMTDKPLYQPAQKIFVRGLAMQRGKSDSGMTVVPDKDFEFSIKDEDGMVLFRQVVKTSAFGIASVAWEIPANAKLGTYRIEADSDDEDLDLANAYFKVSRYELPNFVVQTKADKDFYLPEQKTAEVKVDALYLFGKPVTNGKIKVVRETSRLWNYKEQKWDVDEEDVDEGETDADGKYTAKVDLKKAHESLKEDRYNNFQDLNFTAYFTDFSTNKTEQRRFDLRVTKEPIHVYVHKTGRSYNNHNPKLPLQIYFTTYSADGKPISADVEIKGKYKDETDEKIIANAKTNSLGVGKAEFFAPKREDNEYYENLQLKITARDAIEKIGTQNEEIEIDGDEKQIIVRTDKSLYRKGEPIKIEILSTEQSETVFVDVSRNSSNLASHQIKLTNGRAELKIPYNSEFKHGLTVSAYFDDDGDAVEDSRGVFYPTPKNLRVGVETNKETFRPAEEAAMSFNVANADKKQTQAALGVVILDQAVEERAITDAAFRRGGGINIFQNFNGLSGNSWDDLDTKKPFSAEMQMWAEMRFASTNYETNFFESNYTKNLQSVFVVKIDKQFENIQKVLQKRYLDTFEHPTDEASLKKILSENGIDFDEMRDPWGNKYRAYVYTERDYDALYIWSNGANKVYDRENPNLREDDFVALGMKFNYFTPTGIKINEAVKNYTKKTGKFVRDSDALRGTLAEQDINLDELKDRWGEPYRIEFGVSGRYYTISFKSSGTDKKFVDYSYDDFYIWTNQTDYFIETEGKITAVLNKFIAEKQTFPQTEEQFKQILRDGGIDFDALRDGWNRPFYLQYENRKIFGDKVTIENVAKQGEAAKETLSITPVTREIGIFHVRSLGENGIKDENNYYDDIRFASFAGIISEQTKDDVKPKIVVPKTAFANGKGAIFGVVSDANSAGIPNAEVIITNSETQASWTTKTDSDGIYLQTNLAAGKYSVKVSANLFKTSIINEINLKRENLVEVNVKLEVGVVSEVVVVTADSAVAIVATSDASVSTTTRFLNTLPLNERAVPKTISGGVLTLSGQRQGFQIDGASGAETNFVIDGQEVTNFRTGTVNIVTKSGGSKDGATTSTEKSTPRLREYFPETLLWIPELVTDKNGKVSIKFRLADNITTWKIYAIASDTAGRIGVTSKEIKAFQPFFVDLDPPRNLTEGDEIFLPVQVRNYTESNQKVSVEMAKSDWFRFLNAETRTLVNVPNSLIQPIEVAPNASANATFGFKAIASVNDGKQRVTAIAAKDSDAIEKNVTVRPNGQEIVRTESKLFQKSETFDINFPENALPKTQKAELKIYPNLMAHVAESVEGLLQRPYGCGEQTVSSTYPNLMVLKFTKVDNALTQKAKKYLQKGYERLLGYQVAGGGFSYWGGKSESDLALTAYALRFLNDAKDFIEIDETVIKNAQNYLIKQQRADGSFTKKYSWETSEDLRRTRQLTSYVTRILAMTKTEARTSVKADLQAVLDKALAYLKSRNAEIDEPYALALFGLASLDAGNAEDARSAAEKLTQMALSEGDKVYWNLETNTPFYGWGTAGRIETTALVLQFLIKTKDQNPKTKDLISKATLFLLKSKDRYGVWYSTQTTINVLDALLASLEMNKNQTLQVSLNGEKLKDFAIAANEITPVILDLSDKLLPANHLEITTSDTSSVMAQIVAAHYIDWKNAEISNRETNQSRQLRLNYNCDKQNAKILEEINCSVEAERIGFRGYGMLLAEIGIPPGADVSRESLEKAMETDGSLSRYEVLPDRIVFYMWAKAGGTKFNFKFKPRYAVNAQTPASVLYDYYNEEAKELVAPLKFTVK